VVVENFAALDSEHDNFRAALRWALTSEPAHALELAASLWRFWFLRCHVVEGGDWVERALAAAPAPTLVRAKALIGLTGLNARRGRSDNVRSLSAAAAAIMTQVGEPAEAAAYRLVHATMVWATFDVEEAERIAGQVRTVATKLGRPDLLAGSSWVLAQCALTREDPATADQLLERCLTELADPQMGTHPFLPVVTPCSVVVPVAGRLVPSYEESLLLGRRVGSVQGVGLVLAAMGYAARLIGDLAEASSVVGQAAQHFDVLGDDLGKAQSLNQLGCVLRDAGDFDQGAVHLSQAVAIRHRLGDRRGEWMARANLALLSARRGDIEDGRRAGRACLAAFQGVQDRPSIANAWATLANIELAGGDIRAARDLYDRAIAEFADQSWPRVEAWHRLVAAELCAELGEHARAKRELLQARVLLRRQRCAAAIRRLDNVQASLDRR
jgi:tetratricopeptide (TPR) repeat protein